MVVCTWVDAQCQWLCVCNHLYDLLIRKYIEMCDSQVIQIMHAVNFCIALHREKFQVLIICSSFDHHLLNSSHY